MATAKKHSFTANQIELARLADALSHPVRIQILEILARQVSCVCGKMVDQLPLAQSTVSQHLKQLKEAGLIHGEIDGPKVCYCLDPKIVKTARRAFEDLFTQLCEIKD